MNLFNQHDKDKFSRFFGGLIRMVVKVKFPLHILSFGTGLFVFYSLMEEGVNRYNLTGAPYIGWLFVLAVPVLALLAAGIVEWLHAVIPDLLFRMTCQPRTIVESVPAFVMFLVLAGTTYGVTVISQVTSSGGAGKVARSTYVDPGKTDLSVETEAFRQDSARIAGTAATRIAAAETAYQSAKGRVEAETRRKVAQLRQDLAKHKINRANGNKWADTHIARTEAAISAAWAERKAELAAVEADRDAQKAEALAIQGTELGDLSTHFRQFRTETERADQEKMRKARAENEALVRLAEGGGINLIWAILILSFLKTFYSVHSGYEFQGYAFRPSGRLSRAWSALTGIFADKYDHQVTRLERTRDYLRDRNDASPYALPSTRKVLTPILLGSMFFFLSQSPIGTKAGITELGLLPDSANYLGIILAGVGLALAQWKEDWSGRDKEPPPMPERKKKRVTDRAAIEQRIEMLTLSLDVTEPGEQQPIRDRIELLTLSLEV